MKRLSLIALVAAFVVSAFAFLASSAFAIPVFARKYNTQCNMCHTVPPRLNKFGVAFKENGFELPPGTVLPESEVYGNQVLSNDEPKAIVGAGLPFMVRTGIQLDLSTSTTTIAPPAVQNRFLGIVPPGVAFIGAGSVETSIGGLGFWLDTNQAFVGAAPAAGTLNAIDFDFNFNPLLKVSIGNDFPKVGYGLGLQPLYINTNADGNLAANIVNPVGTGFAFGIAGSPGVEIRGTTNPSTGLGLNYAVGYKTGLQAAKNVGGQDVSTIYGHVGYFIDGINSNIGVGYAIENPAATNAASMAAIPNAGKQLLVDFAYNVGENFLAIVTYSSITPAGLAGTPSVNTISVQPEFVISPELAIGGRYGSLTTSVPNSPTASILSVGVNYKLLQNVLAFVNYTSGSNVNSNVFNATAAGSTIAVGNSFSSIITGLDFIF